ncbi:uncharacterized protein EV422DRAFT_160357 [Fimicolochytrium jonesii]|uniref:uncharacterized protein n=1 Tax=Fimicolochytrium jonesii TaxID=1396493 RepID=UPI0022FE1F3C|nr:uncharacterized protein EV422DRAFT_160357 [Fimicolochytrium jonesii]KAI8826263.1 hypothetical protein EV422DRAFT_160357 [Fimicolochytrium jonesii]
MSDPYVKWSTLLKAFHDHHREGILNLLKECRTRSPKRLPRLLSLTRTVLSNLEAHHTIEDRAIFPILATKFDMSAFEADHADLDSLIYSLNGVVARAGGEDPAGFDWQAFEADVGRLRALVFPHMRREEELTAPEKMRGVFTEREMRALLGGH